MAVTAAPRRTPAPRELFPKRRNAELLLLTFATILVIGAQISAELAMTGRLDTQIVWYALGFIVVWGAAHLAVRFTAPYADPVILPCVALLNGLGLVMIRRLDAADQATAASQGQPDPGSDATAQIAWMILGLVLFIALLIAYRDHRTLGKFTFTLGFTGLFLLALPALLPESIAPTINGAKIWIRAFGFSLQPGEFAKVALLISFAGYLVAKRDVLGLASRKVAGMEFPRARDLGPILLMWVFSLLVLMFQKDLGSSLLFFGIFVALLYIATEKISWVIIGLLMFFGGATLAYQIFGHVQRRVEAWLDPFGSGDAGYQLRQSLFGLGTGGIFGTGWGNGHPEKVPLPKSDFITAALGEELGLIGIVAILVLYVVIIERGFRVALLVRDSFGTLLVAGIAFSIGLQVFVIVGGVTGLIPLTGLTTPFLSYGGSSLLANFVLIALLMRISDAARRPLVRVGASPAISEQTLQVGKIDADAIGTKRNPRAKASKEHRAAFTGDPGAELHAARQGPATAVQPAIDPDAPPPGSDSAAGDPDEDHTDDGDQAIQTDAEPEPDDHSDPEGGAAR